MSSTSLKTRQAAQWLKVHPNTLIQWRKSGKGPKCLKVSDRIWRYELSDLQAYLEAGKVG